MQNIDKVTMNKAKATYQYLTGRRGLTPAQAAGLMGNMMIESRFKTDAEGDGGTSYGAFQMHNTRKTGLFNFAQAQGRDVNSMELQIDYALDGDVANARRDLKKAFKGLTPGKIAAEVDRIWEVSDGSKRKERVEYANHFYAVFHGEPVKYEGELTKLKPEYKYQPNVLKASPKYLGLLNTGNLPSAPTTPAYKAPDLNAQITQQDTGLNLNEQFKASQIQQTTLEQKQANRVQRASEFEAAISSLGKQAIQANDTRY